MLPSPPASGVDLSRLAKRERGFFVLDFDAGVDAADVDQPPGTNLPVVERIAIRRDRLAVIRAVDDVVPGGDLHLALRGRLDLEHVERTARRGVAQPASRVGNDAPIAVELAQHQEPLALRGGDAGLLQELFEGAGVLGRERLDDLGARAIRNVLEDYKRDRAAGDRHHKRSCDVLARSQSPQTLYGTPVALMFYEGAPRLLHAGVHLPYHHDGDASRVVLEAYPGIAARRLIGADGYKNDSKGKQTAAQQRARRDLLASLTGKAGEDMYGFSVTAPALLADDPGADDLDALVCAMQAAWAYGRANGRYGAPGTLDRLEGWIADPALLDE